MFQPESGCRYHQYGRPEILEYFQGSKTDILIVGDSFMRQLFVRLLHLMRGQVRAAAAALCRRAPPLLYMRFRSCQRLGTGLWAGQDARHWVAQQAARQRSSEVSQQEPSQQASTVRDQFVCILHGAWPDRAPLPCEWSNCAVQLILLSVQHRNRKNGMRVTGSRCCAMHSGSRGRLWICLATAPPTYVFRNTDGFVHAVDT